MARDEDSYEYRPPLHAEDRFDEKTAGAGRLTLMPDVELDQNDGHFVHSTFRDGCTK